MNNILTTEQRLIVAADFKPKLTMVKYRESVRKQVLNLADMLHDTGIYFKVNSALRACGYSLIDEIHDRGLLVFADLKIIDIKETMEIDGMLLGETRPEILTTMCFSGIPAMKALAFQLPETEILGVTILTSHGEEECQAMFSCSVEEAVLRFAKIGQSATLEGLISSAKEVEILRAKFGLFLTLNTPAIRPLWSLVPGDGQNPDRVMTPKKAIEAGADRVVVGRPITQAKDPLEAVKLILEEIEGSTIVHY